MFANQFNSLLGDLAGPVIIVSLTVIAVIFIYNIYKLTFAYNKKINADRALKMVEKKIASIDAQIKQNRQKLNEMVNKQYEELKNKRG